jgi:hypothetical protein
LGDLTLADIVSEVQVNLGSRSDLVDGVRVKRLIQLAEQRIGWEYVLPEMHARSVAPSKVLYTRTDSSPRFFNADFTRYLPVGGLAFGGYEFYGYGSFTDGTNYLSLGPTHLHTVGDAVYLFNSKMGVTERLLNAENIGATLLTTTDVSTFRSGDLIQILGYQGVVLNAGTNTISVYPALTENCPANSTIYARAPFTRFNPVLYRRISNILGPNYIYFDVDLDRDMRDGVNCLYQVKYIRAILRLEIQVDDSTTVYNPEPLGNSEWMALVAPNIGIPDDTSSTGPSYYRLVQFEDPGYTAGNNKMQVIEVWPPISGSTVKFRAEYVKEVSPMLADTDVSELQGKDTAIIAQASHLGFQSFGEADDAARWYTVYRDIMNNMTRSQASLPRRAGPRGRASLPRGASGTPWADPFVK